jgi:3-deoxy-D-arabino-heptulosonate 7-phosphate (DAHP) synthase
VDMPLYEILTVNNDGGANIKFYEILTEPKEIMMLLDDETLKSKIKKQDTKNASFIILNAGPTKENYNRIKIEKVIETSSQIEVYVKDSQKNIPSDLSNDDSFRPYTVVKVNSKKAIVIK